MSVPISDEELQRMHAYFNESKYAAASYLHNMDNLRPEMLGANFSFDEYTKIISEERAKLFWFGPEIEIPLILLYVLIMMFGLFANGLICYVIITKKKLRTVRNLFIMNLAISDMIMCALCVPFTLLKLLMKNWPLGSTMCKLVPWLQAVNVFASTITITAIALDRYQVIMYPSYIKDNAKKLGAMGIVVVIWSVSALVGLPLMIFSHVESKQYVSFVTYTICLEEWPTQQSRFVYATMIMLLQFVVPILILITIHWRICTFLKCRIIRNPTTAMEMNRALKEAKRHRKNSTLLMTIAVMYALCWFPLTLLNLLADFNYTIFMSQNFLISFAVAHILAMVSACINPIMYGWFNSNFRQEFTRIVCFWREELVDPERKHMLMADGPLLQKIVYSKKISYKSRGTSPNNQCETALHHHVTAEIHLDQSPAISTTPTQNGSRKSSRRSPQNHDMLEVPVAKEEDMASTSDAGALEELFIIQR